MKTCQIVPIIIACLLSLGCQESKDDTQTEVRDDTASADVDDTVLSYRFIGEGETCIWAGLVAYEDLMPPPMQQLLRCALVDMRPWSALDYGEEAFDIDTAVDDLEAMRTTLGLDSVIVVGHSILGLVAQEYGRRYPDHVRGVVVIGFGPSPVSGVAAFWEENASDERKEADLYWTNRFAPDSVAQEASDWDVFVNSYLSMTARVWFDPYTDPNWLLSVEDGVLNAGLSDQLSISVSDLNVMLSEPAVSRPVFVAMGRHDYLVPYHVWNQQYRDNQWITLHVFEESGHFPMVEEPDLFAELLGAWLSAL